MTAYPDRFIDRLTDAFWSFDSLQYPINSPERMRLVAKFVVEEMRQAAGDFPSVMIGAEWIEARLREDDYDTLHKP